MLRTHRTARLALLCATLLAQSALGADTANDLSVTGYLFATGDLDINGNTASFGAEGSDPGYIVNYVPANDSIEQNATSSTANWIWRRGPVTGYQPQMQLSSANVLTLFSPTTGSAGIVLNPSGYAGIGTPTPAAPLDIQAVMNDYTPAGLIVRRNSTQYIRIHEHGGGNHVIEAVDPFVNQKPLRFAKVTSGGIPSAGSSDITFGFSRDDGGGYVTGFTAMTVQAATGNVGIGASAPNDKLEVVGNAKITGNLNVTGNLINSMLNSSGSGSTSRLFVGGTSSPTSSWQGTTVVGADGQNKIITGYLASFTNGAVIGAHNSALSAWADLNIAGTNLIFRTNETERMRINSAGNVGIGTSTPGATNSGIGQTKLDVVGAGGTNLHVQDTTGYAALGAMGYAEGNLTLVDTNTASGNRAWNINSNDGNLSFRRLSDSYATVINTPFMITPTGNVGIGTSTTPSERLEVNGAVALSALKAVGATFVGQKISDSIPRKILVNIRSGADGARYKIASIEFTGGLAASSIHGRLQMGGHHANYERSATFEIKALNMQDSVVSTLNYIKLGQETAALEVYKIDDWNGQGHDKYDIYLKAGFHTSIQGELDIVASGNHPNVSLAVWQSGLHSGTSVPVGTIQSPSSNYVIDTSGNVGIGTSAPAEKLEVAGNIKLSGNIITSNGTLTVPTAVTGTLLTTTGTQTITGATTVVGTTTVGGASSTEQLRVDGSTGNVGVGTTSTTQKLNVAGTSSFAGKSWFSNGSNISGYSWMNAAITTDSIEIVNNNGTVSNSSPTLGFHRHGSGGPQFRLGPTGDKVLYLESANSNSARNPNPYGGGSNLYFDRFHVDGKLSTSGNVGIGTTPASTVKLHVAGDVRVEGALSTASISRIHPIVIRGTEFSHTGQRLVKIGNATNVAINSRGLSLTLIDKSTHAVLSTDYYDTYASSAASDSLAVALNALDKNQIGILTSADNWEPAITTNLRLAFKRVGLSKAQAAQGDRKPYAAIFEGASNGKVGGNAIEVMLPRNDADQPFAEIRGWLIDGGFAVTPSSVVSAMHSPDGVTQAMLVSNAGDIAVKTTIRVPKRGDIDMGGFTTGTNPE